MGGGSRGGGSQQGQTFRTKTPNFQRQNSQNSNSKFSKAKISELKLQMLKGRTFRTQTPSVQRPSFQNSNFKQLSKLDLDNLKWDVCLELKIHVFKTDMFKMNLWFVFKTAVFQNWNIESGFSDLTEWNPKQILRMHPQLKLRTFKTHFKVPHQEPEEWTWYDSVARKCFSKASDRLPSIFWRCE